MPYDVIAYEKPLGVWDALAGAALLVCALSLLWCLIG